jgi:hypothetical protein
MSTLVCGFAKAGDEFLLATGRDTIVIAERASDPVDDRAPTESLH